MSLVNQTKSFDFFEGEMDLDFDHLAQSVIEANALTQRTARDLKLAVRPKSSNI